MSLIAFGLLVGVLVLEASLRLYFAVVAESHRTPALSGREVKGFVHDARLGARGNPAYPGNDRRGWRNASPRDRADIVALGDSQTYGDNASRDEAWPQRLGANLHRSTYQMALGGYGPGQYLLLFDEAVALRPKVILATYYLGNDNNDSYWLAYHIGFSSDTVVSRPLDAFVSRDRQTREAIQRAEANDPELLRHQYDGCVGPPQRTTDPDLRHADGIPHAPLVPSVKAAWLFVWSRLNPALERSSVLYRITKQSLRRLSQRFARSVAAPDPDTPLCVHYRHGQLSTVFTPGWRLFALDPTDPRVVEGERISLLAFQALAERCRRAGTRFYVVMLPTKETAFRALAGPSLRDKPYLVRMWNAEADARARAFIFFNRVGIRVIDTLPALERVIDSGANPYLETRDGHPTRIGYEAIARAIAARLQRDELGMSR